MRLEREREDGRRDFWEGNAKKNSLELNAGIVNVKHKRETKTFKTPKEAREALKKLEATKRKAGFSDPVAMGSHFLPAALPTNAKLEDAIREDPTDAGPYSVYADWLQSQDSPIGEYVVLAAALEKKKDARKTTRLKAISDELVLPTGEFVTWGTRHGFFQWLRIDNDKDVMELSFEPVPFVQKLFATPLCAALEELRIGILRWDHNHTDVPEVLEAAGAYAWSKSLSRLHLGDIAPNIDMAHHAIGEVGEAITKSFPALRWLKLHGGAKDWAGEGTLGYGGLQLPKLETLIIETCAMTQKRLASVLAAKLPALTNLELWFGSTEDDAGATARDLVPLLHGTVFPKVTHLGLRNQDFSGDLLEPLAASKIAKRLVHLDLSMCTLDDDGYMELGTRADSFPKLRTLDVSDNFLSQDALKELQACFKKVTVVSSGQPKPEYGAVDDRFVTVSE